jgi:hypothetical protein
MASTQTRIRRGTAAQVASMTPASSEVVHNTTNNRLHIGNGSTAGGLPIPNYVDIQTQAFTTGTVGGTADAITLTLSPAPASYTNLAVEFKASGTNTGAVTIDVNTLGAKDIYVLKAGVLSALAAGDIVSGAIYRIVYDGTQFQIISGGGGSSRASTSEVANESNVDKYISPDRLRDSPLVPKCVAYVNQAGTGSATLVYGQNVASITNSGTRINFDTPMATSTYFAMIVARDNSSSGGLTGSTLTLNAVTQTTTYIEITRLGTGTHYLQVIIFE